MFTKILFLCSAINLGDVGHTNQLTENLRLVSPDTQAVTIDANASIDSVTQTYQKTINSYQQNSYVICAVGQKGLHALTQLEQQNLINREQAYVAASIHQYFDELNNVSLDFLAIPEGTLPEQTKALLKNKINKLSLLFAVPASNPTQEVLKKSYESWDDPQKPTLHQDAIIVMLPGDAPDASGNIQCFTQASAKKLFDQLYDFWKAAGSRHKIIIQNGPRTGKHDAIGTVICAHEYNRNTPAEQAIDAISKYFVSLCKEKNLDYAFFNFAFELDGTKRTSNSVFNQLLYVAQQPKRNNYFILPGESVSMLGQIPLYLPANKIIVFKPDSMNQAHNNIFTLGVQREYFSYFSDTGDIITPTHTDKRTNDDGKQVVHDLIESYMKKFINNKKQA